MGKRADAAADVGSLLTLTAPRTPPAAPAVPATAATTTTPQAASPSSFGSVLHKAVFGF